MCGAHRVDALGRGRPRRRPTRSNRAHIIDISFRLSRRNSETANNEREDHHG